jgi:hypothetical protein
MIQPVPKAQNTVPNFLKQIRRDGFPTEGVVPNKSGAAAPEL